MSTPTKPPPKPHRKGQKSYDQKSYEKRPTSRSPLEGEPKSAKHDAVGGYSKKPYNKDARPSSSRSPVGFRRPSGEGEPKSAKHDASEGYTKKPFRKREDNPLLESAPRPTRYAARFESKTKPHNSAEATTPSSTRRGELSAPQQGSDDVRRMREAPARSTVKNATQSSNNSDRATERRASPEPVSLRSAGSAKQETTPIRLAKRMSDAGLCSRREAERHIEAGRVTVNGERITTCATLVNAQDMVRLDDKLVKNTAQDVRLFLFHKPRGALTTNADPEGRPTIYDLLPKDLPRVVSVGRLDFDSEGLLLLTTSGALARTLELPATGLPRTYRVRVHGTPSPESLAKLRRGMEVDGVRYGAMEVHIEDTDSEGRNRWVEVTLREGKNREIRRVFTALSHHVTRLIRTHYGPFELGKLPRGALIEMKPRDWKKSLRDVLPQAE